MPLVTKELLVLDLAIPNKGHQAEAERLDAMISKLEPKFLESALGGLYYVLKPYFDAEPLPIGFSVPERYLWLRDGSNYIDNNGKLRYWKGLLYSVGNIQYSPIAYYVYYFYQRLIQSHTTGVSTATHKTPEGMSINPVEKMLFAWNEMSEMVEELCSFLWNKKGEVVATESWSSVFSVRDDEQIKVGVTPGFVSGANSFTFDGTNGRPDYRGLSIVPSELNGRGIIINGLDYSWDAITGKFTLLLAGDKFIDESVYNIHFNSGIVQSPVTVNTSEGQRAYPEFSVSDMYSNSVSCRKNNFLV